jgi:hypothetical protein
MTQRHSRQRPAHRGLVLAIGFSMLTAVGLRVVPAKAQDPTQSSNTATQEAVRDAREQAQRRLMAPPAGSNSAHGGAAVEHPRKADDPERAAGHPDTAPGQKAD